MRYLFFHNYKYKLGTPLVVLGESGLGKSALLANWAARYQQHHTESILIPHFIGCSPVSSNYGGLILRIMQELVEKLRDPTIKVPTNAQSAIGMY